MQDGNHLVANNTPLIEGVRLPQRVKTRSKLRDHPFQPTSGIAPLRKRERADASLFQHEANEKQVIG